MNTQLRDRLILAVALLIVAIAFVVDVFLFPGVILPGPPFFASILLAAYFLSPRETAWVAVFATILKLTADLVQGTPLWLLILYFIALVLVGVAGVALSSKIRHEAALAEERERLKVEAEQRTREVENLAEIAQRRAAELDEANKDMEAFSYSVSHDLRAPLRHIDGFSRILLQDYADKLDPQGQQYLQFLRDGSQKMDQLIEAMLKLSRVTRAEIRRQPVNLSEIAQSVAAELHKEEPERQLDLAVSPGIVANGDPQLLRIVMENLVGNAWKFTSKRPSSGRMTRIEFGVERQDAMPVYYVKDNGAGFDIAFADKLFIPFQRLHSAGEFPGTGIGLATVQRIVSRHGGRVWAEGEVDKGATFFFTLGKQSAISNQQDGEAVPSPSGRGLGSIRFR